MSYTVTEESFDSIAAYQADRNHRLDWSSVFVLPTWLKVWWQEFGAGAGLHLGAVRQGEDILGISPLLVKEKTAAFIGSDDVCDYLDFVITPGRETDFFNTLLDDLRQKGISTLDLGTLRPDSTVLTHLTGITRGRGYQVSCQPEDISLELDLPSTWEEYLGMLNTKQRHELRRKLRRLSEAGNVDYHTLTDSQAVLERMDTFLKMFAESRSDKATFLTSQRESFFRVLVDTMAGAELLRLGVLELDGLPVAMLVYFVYNNCVYLYNSGYDAQYKSLSVGLLSKALCIRDSIQEGRKRFDFLKGDEPYKYHLAGREVPLHRCRITIK